MYTYYTYIYIYILVYIYIYILITDRSTKRALRQPRPTFDTESSSHSNMSSYNASKTNKMNGMFISCVFSMHYKIVTVIVIMMVTVK